MRRTDHGFTLLEVLVAMAVLGAVLPAIMIAFTTSARTRASSENGTTAAYLVRDKLSEMEALGAPEEGEDAGDFGEGSRFTWATTVGPTETEELYDVVVRVQWLEMGEQRELAVRTYMAGQGDAEGGGPGGGQGPGGPGG
jgi:type II secretion system protein I